MIYISHTEADKSLVHPLAQKLASVFGRDNVFYDSWSIQPGESIIGKMNEGLVNCKFFFFFMSKKSLQSKMVDLEWQPAIFMATKGRVKFIPVKLDESSIPPILLEKKYIDFPKLGFEGTLKTMSAVIEGRNVFDEEETKEFRNIRGYVSDVQNGVRIEFRAEIYPEPQSKFVILFTNAKFEDIECGVEGISMPIQYVENASEFNKQMENAIIVSRPTPTSPGFPFIVTLKSKTPKVLLITGLMAAISSTQAKSIPVVYNGRTFIPS